MIPLADHWYTSGTFLGVTGIVVAVVAGAVGVWTAFRAANPRQDLAYQVLAVVPLLTQQAHNARNIVEIRLDDKVLAHPRVVELRMVNRGRRDIPTSAFDQGRLLRLDVAVPILKILKNETVPDGFRPPRIDIDRTAIVLGPDLIKKGQATTLSLLVDGGEPHVTVPEPPFIDIRVRRQPGDAEFTDSIAVAWSAVVSAATAATAVTAVTVATTAAAVTAVTAAAVVWAAVATVTAATMRWRRRRDSDSG